MASQLDQAEATLKRLEAAAPNISSQVKTELLKKFDNNKGYLQDVANYERVIVPNYYETFANQGTGAADLSPAQKMAMASREVNRMGGLADVARGVLTRQDTNINDILKSLLQTFDLQLQGANSAYTRAWNKQQAARSSGGSGANYGSTDWLNALIASLGAGENTGTPAKMIYNGAAPAGAIGRRPDGTYILPTGSSSNTYSSKPATKAAATFSSGLLGAKTVKPTYSFLNPLAKK